MREHPLSVHLVLETFLLFHVYNMYIIIIVVKLIKTCDHQLSSSDLSWNGKTSFIIIIIIVVKLLKLVDFQLSSSAPSLIFLEWFLIQMKDQSDERASIVGSLGTCVGMMFNSDEV